MKQIRNIKLKAIIILFSGSLIMPSCQERLDEMNKNPNALTIIRPEYLFTHAVRETFRTGHHRLQADFGSQYAHLAVSDSWDRTTDTYDLGHLRGDVTQSVFKDRYKNAIKYCNDIFTITAEDGDYPNVLQSALADVVAVMNFALLTDLFGDVPYFEGAKGKEGIFLPKYDKQEDIYADMVARLEASITTMKSGDFADAFPGADPLYNNDKDKWIRFTNSLRLRLAMRARFADAGKYEPIIENCLAEDLIESNDQSACLEHYDSEIEDLQNPWYEKYKDRVESKLYNFNVSEKFVDWLRHTNDPRLGVLVTKATLSDEYIAWLTINNDPRLEYVTDPENAYFGMRNGLNTESRDGSEDITVGGEEFVVKFWPRKDMSTLTLAVLAKDQLLNYMTASEIWFLRAEAALFSIGTNGPEKANEFYQKGIEMAMMQWDIDPTDYLTNSSEANLEGTEEEMFEQISTQMWVAFVPNYIEAWFNIRRTGYPVIEQRTSPELSRGVTNGYMPRRLVYPQTTERAINSVNMQMAIDRMGGQDKFDIPVWWDKNGSN